MSEFFQDPPRLGNQYDDDGLLRAYLRWRLPPKLLAEIELDLRRLGHRAATEGMWSTAYERTYGAHSRIDQFARLYLFAPSSALYSCPLAMTDGAARFLEVHGDATTQP